MALPLGKLTVLVGAGIVGSVLAKEGRMSNVSDFFSGALKIVFKQIKKDDATTLRAKPPNDSLLAQVNSLRQELQLLASNRPITVVASTGSGGSRYGVIVVVLIVGYGYVWWKIVLIGLGSELPDILIDLANRVLTLVIACQNMGWKLPDLMFATRRSLSEASGKIAKELENVYSSISATKRHLSSKIDRVDSSLDEFAELTAATQGEVSELRGNMKVVGGDVRSVRHAVQTLETKLNRIEGKQNYTVENVVKLVDVAWTLENSRMKERIQATPSSSSMPALELPQSGSLTPTSTLELPSPSASDESHKVKLHLQSAVSASGLKELHGISDVQEPSRSPEVSNGVHVTEDTNPNNSSSGVFGRRLSGLSAAFISRTYSAMPSFK